MRCSLHMKNIETSKSIRYLRKIVSVSFPPMLALPWYTVKTIYYIEILDCENISRESSRVTLFNQQKQPSN